MTTITLSFVIKDQIVINTSFDPDMWLFGFKSLWKNIVYAASLLYLWIGNSVYEREVFKTKFNKENNLRLTRIV
jgi:hypothetical protein